MITFYFDGFRGLENTFVPLLDVNFLVGENSTGKSSVLSAMQVLSGDAFWYTGEFRHEHIDFGTFQEIATPGRSSFRIGYVKARRENDPEFAVLATFESRNQKPTLTSIRVLSGREEAELTDSSRQHGVYKDKSVGAIFQSWLESSTVEPNRDVNLTPRRKVESNIVPIHVTGILHIDAVWILNRPTWIAPIRAKPKRTYDPVGPDYSPEGDHIPYLLKRMLEAPAQRGVLQQFGRNSGLFTDIHVHRFGNDALSPLSIDVELGDLRTSIFNVGYGVSQALPILVEAISGPDDSLFSIQQPEVHLHPKAQAALGNLFFELSRKPHNKGFLLETHSDFIVDRFRMCMRKAADAGEQVPSTQVLFFQRHGDKNVITPLVLEPRGDYPEDQPPEFREFFLQEALRDLGF